MSKMDTKVATIVLNSPILTEKSHNMNEIVLIDKNKELLELLKEARPCLAEHIIESESVCSLCGDIQTDDCKKSYQFELAKRIDCVLEEYDKEINK